MGGATAGLDPASRTRELPGPPRARELPGPPIHPLRRTFRYLAARTVATLLARSYVRVRVEGRELLPDGPFLLCFNHQSWTDPLLLLAGLPTHRRLYVFGPREEDMRRGARNRLIAWVGNAVPFHPSKDDLLAVTRRVQAVFAAGGVLAVSPEGRIHSGERVLLPFDEGAAYFAFRSRVPIVPVALNGTSWLCFGRRIRIRIGAPILPRGRATRESVASCTLAAWQALHELVQGYPDPAPPGPVGRWVTELFNDWPEGSRPEPGS